MPKVRYILFYVNIDVLHCSVKKTYICKIIAALFTIILSLLNDSKIESFVVDFVVVVYVRNLLGIAGVCGRMGWCTLQQHGWSLGSR